MSLLIKIDGMNEVYVATVPDHHAICSGDLIIRQGHTIPDPLLRIEWEKCGTPKDPVDWQAKYLAGAETNKLLKSRLDNSNKLLDELYRILLAKRGDW